MARRKLSVFNLSFLDIMSCGFGAIVLFYMIITAQISVRADEANDELLSESRLLEDEVLDGRKDLVRLLNTLESKEKDTVTAQGEARRLQQMIEELIEELAQYEDTSLANKDSIEKLKSDIERLEEAKKRLSAQSQIENEDTGSRVRTFTGEGNRQYLTGLKMGGDRVLILLDSSTSMLGRTYINVVQYRLMEDDMKIKAPKWRHAIKTVDWLTTQIVPGTKFQIMTFNEEASSVIEDSDGEWVDVTDGSELDDAIESLKSVVPGKGTSLFNAFAAITELDPPPDNVFLLTDGLPTQGKNPPGKVTKVKPGDRVKFFNQAMQELPSRVPVNVLLYPMDGDPDAAGHFWRLALDTRGSFMTPSEDWP